MKLEENNREVVTNTSNKHDFRIQANAKMFEILSSRIYTYSLAAIVREISCNAYDAHVESGKRHVPFKVVLPNDLHPYFEIEDFGVGLSESQVYDVYTEYGNSTKTDSNEVIGALGLGSKTPFAYTTSFTIQTRKDGVECLFNAYIGDSGAPTATLLRKRDTDEPNGVKIKIPVKTGQEDLFRKECQFILSFFPVRPNVVGNSEFQFDIDEDLVASIHEGNLTVSPVGHVRSELYRSKRLYAVMGTVCYPIQLSDLDDIGERQFKYLEKVVLCGDNSNAAFLKFDIGDLEVSAAREGLSIEDGKSTEKVLNETFQNALTELMEQDGKLIEDCTHPNHALAILMEKYGDVLPLVAGQFKYKGQTLDRLVRRKFKSPYGEAYHSIKRQSWWSASRSSTVTKRTQLHAQEIVNDGYVILNAQKAKTRGWMKFTRQLAREYRGKILVTTDGTWSDHQIARFQQYVGKPAEKILVLEDLKQQEKDNKPASAVTKKTYKPKKKQEVTGCSFLLAGDECSYRFQHRLDIQELRDQDYNVVYTERSRINPYDTVRFKIDDKSYSVSTMMFRKYHVFLGNTIIILANNKNQKAIDENKIPHLSDQLTDLKKNRQSEVQTLSDQLRWFKVINGTVVFENEWLEIARMTESSILPQSLYDLHADAEANIDVVSQYSGSYGSTVFSELLHASTNYNEMESGIVEDLRGRYPMLRQVNRYQLEPQSTVDVVTLEVLQYMRMVDSYIEDQQYKLTA